MCIRDSVFADAQRAKNQLMKYHKFLTSMKDEEEFADLVLAALMPFERPKQLRNLIRTWFPDGRSGYVAMDMDLVVRVFGHQYDSDSDGRFRFIETKWSPETDKPTTLGPAQLKTFGLIDRMCRTSEMADRYDGFYVITHTHFLVDEGRVWLQRPFESNQAPCEVSVGQLRDWLSFQSPAVKVPQDLTGSLRSVFT